MDPIQTSCEYTRNEIFLAIFQYFFSRWFICTFSCFSNSEFWSFLPCNRCLLAVNNHFFFTEFDLPWLLFSNSLCKHGPKTVFGIVLYIGWWKWSSFFSIWKKKKSRGFIFIVRKYRGHSVHNLTPFFLFFLSSVDNGSNCKLYQQVALETAYSAS